MGLLTAAVLLPVVPALAAAPAGPVPGGSPATVTAADLGDRGADRVARAALDAAGHDGAGYEVESVRRSLVGTHLRGRELRGGVPVEGSDFVVSLVGGRVAHVAVDPAPDLPGGPAGPGLRRGDAERLAAARLGVTSSLRVTAERVLVPTADRLVDTWRVWVTSLRPAVAARVDLDAATGRVLAVTDDRRHVEGSAKVFDPNPVVTRRDASLRQPLEQRLPADADLDSPELTAARVVLPLRDLDPKGLAAGRLSGPFVEVIAGGYAPGSVFDVTRADPRFEGLMAYAHLDRVQRYFQSLGFHGEAAVNAEPQDVVATRVEGFDNSFYQPGNDLMLLGTGGVDDGEDAEVILHEYGHAVHDAQVPGWGRAPEGGAMGEGFGDFLAAAYYARTSGGFQDTCIMDWDATSYSASSPPCLRRADSPKRYPKDLKNQVHADGEMWSSFLWRLRGRLHEDPARHSDEALRLVLASHEFLTPAATFGPAVAALRQAAVALGHPEWQALIDEEARTTGFPLS